MTDNKRKITVSFGIEGRLNEAREFSENVFIKLNTAFRNKQLRELKGAPLSVFMCLALHMNQKGECWPSNSLIEKETGYKEDAILKAKLKLEKEGYIHRKQERWSKKLIKKRFPNDFEKKIEEMKAKLGTWAPPTYTLFPPEEDNSESEKLSTGEELSTGNDNGGESTDPENTRNGENPEMTGSSPFRVLTGTVKDRNGFEPERLKPGTKKNHGFEVEPEKNNNKNHSEDREQKGNSESQQGNVNQESNDFVVVKSPPAKKTKSKKSSQVKKLLVDAGIKIPDDVIDPLLAEKRQDTVTIWIEFIKSNPKKVENPGGFLRMALEKDWPLPADFERDIKRREKRKEQQQREKENQRDNMEEFNSWLSKQNVPELCRDADQYAESLPRSAGSKESMRVFYIWDKFTRDLSSLPDGEKIDDALGSYADVGRNMIKSSIQI